MPLSSEQRASLQAMSRSDSLPHRTVIQSRALLWAGEGIANEEIARRCQVDSDAVRRWRVRFADQGTDGVGRIAKGRGRKPKRRAEMTGKIVHASLFEAPPDTGTHWTTRSLADYLGTSKDMVRRVWQDHQFQPWRVDYFKISTDPQFEEKLIDVVGLYMNPPEKARVFSFDEKTQVQALDRTQPGLPMKKGRAGTMTHDYKRHGTVDLFAAIDVATGKVITDTRKRHTSEDVLEFFKVIDKQVPRELSVHVVLDNLSAHMGPKVATWLRHPRRSRWRLHFTPTSSSWVNLIEQWFNHLTERRIRRGVFTSVASLVEAIETWSATWNQNPRPFVWRRPAEEIIAKVARGRAALSLANSAADH